MYKNIITKEELSLLPKENFEGRIDVVTTEEEMLVAINILRNQNIIGFDTETKPSFVKGVTGNQVALLQLSTSDHCFLFRLNLLGFPKALVELIADEKIQKVGISLRDDFQALRKRTNVKPGGFVDLQTIAVNYGIEEKSLQKIYAVVFNKRISKTQRLSNWEAEELTDAQKEYAAIDAWACLRIYQSLFQQNN